MAIISTAMTGAHRLRQSQELTSYITNDGRTYVLTDPPNRWIVSEEGLGMPPIQYVTQRGPYQHGESLRDFFLKPRIVQIIIRHNYCDRKAYWAGRSSLLNVLLPNRNPLVSGVRSVRVADGVLHKVLPDGTSRDLSCIIEQGPNFAPRDPTQWDELSYTETLRFVAHNPIYYDPAPKITTILNATVGTFPLTFPFSFVDPNVYQTLTYAGNWPEYPTITIVGPINNFSITNHTTGQTITLAYYVPDSYSATFTLLYGNKQVTLSDGTNLIGYITADSDLVGFQLVPGANVLSVVADMDGPVTPRALVTISYFNRYIGI